MMAAASVQMFVFWDIYWINVWYDLKLSARSGLFWPQQYEFTALGWSQAVNQDRGPTNTEKDTVLYVCISVCVKSCVSPCVWPASYSKWHFKPFSCHSAVQRHSVDDHPPHGGFGTTHWSFAY